MTRARLASALVALSVAALACGSKQGPADDGVASVDVGPHSGGGAAGSTSSGGASGSSAGGAAGDPNRATGTVDELGGVVLGPNGAEIDVPEGAVPGPTEIGIAVVDPSTLPPLPDDAEPLGAVYELTPHGVTFSAPVEVYVPYVGVDDETDDSEYFTVLVHEEGSPLWNEIPAANEHAATPSTPYAMVLEDAIDVALDGFSHVVAARRHHKGTTCADLAKKYGWPSYGCEHKTDEACNGGGLPTSDCAHCCPKGTDGYVPVPQWGGYVGWYNNPGQRHHDVCVRLANQSASLRATNGADLGFDITKPELVVINGQPKDANGNPIDAPSIYQHVCKKGEHHYKDYSSEMPGVVILDADDVVRGGTVYSHGAPGGLKTGDLLFFRGGFDYVPPGGSMNDVPYGHVRYEDLAGTIDPSLQKAGHGATNGLPCDSYESTTYHFDPKPIDDIAMRYWMLSKPHTGGDIWQTIGYAVYGDDGAASFAKNPAFTPPYSASMRPPPQQALTWSWVNVGSGGVDRAIFAAGDVFQRCTTGKNGGHKLKSVKLGTIDARNGPDGKPVVNANGSAIASGYVWAVYGRAKSGNGPWINGWTIWSHCEPTTATPQVGEETSCVLVPHFK